MSIIDNIPIPSSGSIKHTFPVEINKEIANQSVVFKNSKHILLQRVHKNFFLILMTKVCPREIYLEIFDLNQVSYVII